jgi:hypothetical protein
MDRCVTALISQREAFTRVKSAPAIHEASAAQLNRRHHRAGL